MDFNVQSLNIKRKNFIDMYSKYESFKHKNFWATSFLWLYISYSTSQSQKQVPGRSKPRFLTVEWMVQLPIPKLISEYAFLSHIRHDQVFRPQHRPWDVQRIGAVSKVDLTQDTMALLVLSQRFHCIKGHFDLRYHGFIGPEPTIPLRNWNECSLLKPCSILTT